MDDEAKFLQDLGATKEAVKNNRAAILEVKGSINAMAADLKGIAAAINKNGETSRAAVKEIQSLKSHVDGLSGKADDEVREIHGLLEKHDEKIERLERLAGKVITVGAVFLFLFQFIWDWFKARLGI